MPRQAVGWACVLTAVAGLAATGGSVLTLRAAQRPTPGQAAPGPHQALVDEYCVSCHDEVEKIADLALDSIEREPIAAHPDVWEKVVRKLRSRQMPQVGKPRPDEVTYDRVIAFLETSLDRAAASRPNPGRTATLRRLTRTE